MSDASERVGLRKGISPLIAGVLLVAFTLAVGGIAASFFLSITSEQSERTSDSGSEVVDCGSTSVRINPSSTSWDGSTLTVNVENTGTVAAQIPEMAVFNDSDVVETIDGPVPASGFGGSALNTSSNTLPAGGFVTFTESISYNPKRVTVRTGCSGRSSTAENASDEFALVFN